MGPKPRPADQKSGRRQRKRKLRTAERPVQDNVASRDAAVPNETPDVDVSQSHSHDKNLQDENASELIKPLYEEEKESQIDHGNSQDRKSPSKDPPGKSLDLSSDAAAEEAFKKFYLRKITEELAEDLDKARSAPDFSERSLPILIEALQQGVGTFTQEERIMIGKTGLGVDRS